MTGLKKTIEFCLPKTLIIPRGEAEGKQNSVFPEGPVIKYFCTSRLKKKKEKKSADDLLDACGGCARSTNGS